MNPLDESVLQVDVGIEGLVVIDDTPAFDEQPVTLQSQAKDRVSLGKSRGFFSF